MTLSNQWGVIEYNMFITRREEGKRKHNVVSVDLSDKQPQQKLLRNRKLFVSNLLRYMYKSG